MGAVDTDMGIHQHFPGYEGDVLFLDSAPLVSTVNEGPCKNHHRSLIEARF